MSAHWCYKPRNHAKYLHSIHNSTNLPQKSECPQEFKIAFGNFSIIHNVRKPKNIIIQFSYILLFWSMRYLVHSQSAFAVLRWRIDNSVSVPYTSCWLYHMCIYGHHKVYIHSNPVCCSALSNSISTFLRNLIYNLTISRPEYCESLLPRSNSILLLVIYLQHILLFSYCANIRTIS